MESFSNDPMFQSQIAKWQYGPILFDSGLPLCEYNAGESPWKITVVFESLWQLSFSA
jgi:hypothetical protein